MAAWDGQTLESQGADVAAMFGGDAARWEQEHNDALRQQGWTGPNQPPGSAPKTTAPTPTPSQPAAAKPAAAPTAAAPSTPSPLAGVSMKDVSETALQGYFNNALLLSQQAINGLRDQGITPQMRWDANAYGQGIGGFVPTANMVPTLVAVNQQFAINRAQIDQVARVLYQSGRAPRLTLNPQGMLVMQTDAQGNPVFDETIESRNSRLAAGQATGFVSTDLTKAPQSGAATGSVTPGNQQTPQLAPTGADTTAAPTDAYSGQTWDNISPEARQQFVNQWGEPAAQARWEWENAKNGGQDPGSWADYAKYRGVPDAAIAQTVAQESGVAPTGSEAAGFTPAPAGSAEQSDPWASAPVASDGASLRDQDEATKSQFVAQWGSPQAAALAWVSEHERDLTSPGWRDQLGDNYDPNKPLAQQWLDNAATG
jgi:hypothetical protein